MMRLGFLGCIFGLALSTHASAATLSATALNTNVTDFSVSFEDRNLDGLIETGEVTGFSGVSISNFLGQTFVLDQLVFVADISGISINGSDKWLFSNTTIGNYDHAASNWRYQISTTPVNPVPLPASAVLLLMGVMGLFGFRRKHG